MKRIYFASLLSLLFFTACEKVVDINLNDAAPQYVIEGTVFEGDDTVKVTIARTTDFYGRAPQEMIDDAIVTLSDDTGTNVNIPNVGDGLYLLPGFKGISGRTYQLRVQAGNQVFTASSVMQPVVAIDSITQEFEPADFRAEGYEVTAHLVDPAGSENYYRMVYTINDTLQDRPNNLYLFNDKFNNGRPIRADLFRRFQAGDKITFELRTMDARVWDFFSSLSDVLNNQNGPAPANPNTNIEGGALGYFGAFTASRMTIVVSE